MLLDEKNLDLLFEELEKKKEIIVTYKNKKAKILPVKEDIAFGMWRDREDLDLKKIREGRNFE